MKIIFKYFTVNTTGEIIFQKYNFNCYILSKYFLCEFILLTKNKNFRLIHSI